MQPHSPMYLSTYVLARLAGCTPDTVQRHIREGRLSTRRFGPHRIVRRDAKCERFIAARTLEVPAGLRETVAQSPSLTLTP